MKKHLLTRLSGRQAIAAAMLLLGAGGSFAQQWTEEEFLKIFSNSAKHPGTKTIELGNTCLQSEDALKITDLEIPETVLWGDGDVYTVSSIGSAAFLYSKNLKTVTVPATVSVIGVQAFSKCEQLESVEFKGHLSTVEEYAFWDSAKLSGVTFAGGVDFVGQQAFDCCTALTDIDWGAGVKNIDIFAFAGCGIKNFVFPDGLETVTLPMANQGEFISVTFPQSLKEIKGDVPMYLTSYGETGGFEKLSFNVTDLEAWCTTPIAGYDPKKYKTHDVYDENGSWLGREDVWTGEYVDVTVNYRGKEISSLNVPMGVESLKPYAFAGISGLTSVALPDDLKEIGEGVFGGTGLSTIEIPEGVETIGAYAFSTIADFQEIVLPQSLTSLGDYAFARDIALYEIEIPASVKRIRAHAFDGCVDLETVTLNEGLEEIGEGAFLGTSRIKEMAFPASLREIGSYAFYVNNITELEFGNEVTTIGDYAFARYNIRGLENCGDSWWDVDSHLEDPTSVIKFGKGLESIGAGAFAGWNVRNISFPDGLQTIGKDAFEYSYISDVKLPAAMTALSDRAFERCYKLATVTFPEGLESIGARAFANTSVRELNFPTSLKEIGEAAFEAAPVVNAVIPDGVTSIGEKAFTNISYLTIGKGVAAISKPVAESCDMLKMLRPTPPTLSTDRLGFEPKVVIVPAEAGDTYRKNNRWKDYNIFAEGENRAVVNVNKEKSEQLADQLILQSRLMPAQVASLTVHGSLDDADWAVIRSNMTSLYDLDLSNISNTELPAEVLADKTILLNLTLPQGLTKIGDRAFKGCSLLHIAELPSTLVEIGESAFEDCKSLDSNWTMPASLTTVGGSAFAGCESLKGLDFSATAVTELPAGNAWYGMFDRTYSLASLVLPQGLTELTSSIFKQSGLRTIELPEGIKSIDNEAFMESALESIVIPEGIESIGEWAFAGTRLEAIELPASLRTLGYNAFSGAPLVYASFNNGLEEISEAAFSNCQDLMVVNLPTSLKTIGSRALAAPGLAAINAPIVEPAATDGNPFNGVDNLSCALSIPRQSFTDYIRAEYWGSFVGVRNNIDVTIPEEVPTTYIDDDDYQEMLEDMQEEEETPEEPVSARRRGLRVLRANSLISTFKGYGKLFDGAALFRDGKGKTRFFVDVEPEQLPYVKVEYNNVDITSQIDPETRSFVTEPLTANATLRITYNGKTGIDEIEAAGQEQAPVDVYDLTGRRVLTNATDFSTLPAGIYIAGGKKIYVK